MVYDHVGAMACPIDLLLDVGPIMYAYSDSFCPGGLNYESDGFIEFRMTIFFRNIQTGGQVGRPYEDSINTGHFQEMP